MTPRSTRAPTEIDRVAFAAPTRRPPKPTRPQSMLVDNNVANLSIHQRLHSVDGISSHSNSLNTTPIRPSRSTALFRRIFGSLKDKSYSVTNLSPTDEQQMPLNNNWSHRLKSKSRRPVSEIFSSALRLNNTPHKPALRNVDRIQRTPKPPNGILKQRQQSASPAPRSATKSAMSIGQRTVCSMQCSLPLS